MTEISFTDEIKELEKRLKKAKETSLGYPANANLDHCTQLSGFLKYSINNIGDPFIPSNYKINTLDIEKKVLDFFAKLYNIPNNYWGYITNGGTESNMYGLFLARELYTDGIVYYSQDAHYSIKKILRILNMKNIEVKTLHNGEMDYKDLELVLQSRRDTPAIIVATIGTTMKGAIDNVRLIKDICENLRIPSYVHADAALSGHILPFLKNSPKFDFSAGVSSVSVSGHKMIGSPIPCGVVITKNDLVNRISQRIEYIDSLDTTIMGSRNGFTSLILWQAIKLHKANGFKKMAEKCIEMADYTLEQLKKINWEAWRNDFSNTVVIKRPSKKLAKKWQLASQGDISHIITMPQIDKILIDNFIAELEIESQQNK
ncbi:MAG: histidine decarboxylase [Alphaproteobacteria bacterium]|nr:histidine decarboxylase [Alphaproteobacteria bacterium]